jgi:hypothetical protein
MGFYRYKYRHNIEKLEKDFKAEWSRILEGSARRRLASSHPSIFGLCPEQYRYGSEINLYSEPF